MPLMNCPECNTEIPSTATQCPECACPLPAALQGKDINSLFPSAEGTVSSKIRIQMPPNAAPRPRTVYNADVPLPGLKNMVLAVLLPVLFGPLGLFYASTKRALYTIGALIFISVVNAEGRAEHPTAYAARLVLLGLGSWLGSIIASVVMVDKHNKRVRQQYLATIK